MNLTSFLALFVAFGWIVGFLIAGIAYKRRSSILSGTIAAISSMMLVLSFLLFCYSWGKQPNEAWSIFSGHFGHWIKWFVASMIIVAFIDCATSMWNGRHVIGFEVFSEIWGASVALWLGAFVFWDWILPLIGQFFQLFGGMINYLWQMGVPPG